jgi:hypothetical protein
MYYKSLYSQIYIPNLAKRRAFPKPPMKENIDWRKLNCLLLMLSSYTELPTVTGLVWLVSKDAGSWHSMLAGLDQN